MDKHAVININIFGKVSQDLKAVKEFYLSVKPMGLHVAYVKPWIILSKKKLNKRTIKDILKTFEQNLVDNKIKIIGKHKKRKCYIFSEKTLMNYVEKRERKSREKGEPKFQWAFFSKKDKNKVHQWFLKKPTMDELNKANKRIRYFSK